MKELIPGKDNVLLELDAVEEDVAAEGKTDDGGEYKIVTPEIHHQRSRRATILAVGRIRLPEDRDMYKPGDRVIVSFYTGIIVHDFELGWHDDTHKVCRYDQILGKIGE